MMQSTIYFPVLGREAQSGKQFTLAGSQSVSNITAHADWKKHHLGDLMSSKCSLGPCDLNQWQFRSSQEWADHLLSHYPISQEKSVCPLGPVMTFRSRDHCRNHCRDHYREYHKEDIVRRDAPWWQCNTTYSVRV
ncbi:hypothetical protein F5Y19DRAFT_429446 [Xylariaceae sp. FL1651]|nr:hypothetical protein F5Y19DRAFT_429446 [Xylariaceae sp. FL1651]